MYTILGRNKESFCHEVVKRIPLLFHFKQECIPVGCILPAAVAIRGVSRHPPRPGTPLWTEFLTHAYENITLPQTSFAGGNESNKNGRRINMFKSS